MAQHHCMGKIKEKQGKLKEDQLRKEAAEQAQKCDVTFHTGDPQMEGIQGRVLGNQTQLY